jgi:hypothetical protein
VIVEGAISKERREGCFWKGKINPPEFFGAAGEQRRFLCNGLCLARRGKNLEEVTSVDSPA